MNSNVKKWVEALRSGEFGQACERLQDNNDYVEGKTTYCCLGVACRVYERETGFALPENLGKFNDDTLAPYQEVQEWLGLSSHVGAFHVITEGAESLVELNDGVFDFDQIADFIESEPSGLFVSEGK